MACTVSQLLTCYMLHSLVKNSMSLKIHTLRIIPFFIFIENKTLVVPVQANVVLLCSMLLACIYYPSFWAVFLIPF